MFTSIANFIKGLLEGLWTAFFNILTSVWTVACAIGAFFVWVFDFVKAGVVSLVHSFDGINFGSLSAAPSGSLTSYCNIANTFFPLSEFCSFLILWFALLAALTLYRAIKSWIPGGFG